MPLIVKELSYTYNKGLPTEHPALHGVSFEASGGEIISILGHTGSGKSTLAQHLNALIIPQRGSVLVDGADTSSGSAAAREARRKVGLVFQYPEEQIFAETVAEEIAFAPRNWGVSEEDIQAIIPAAIKAVGLDEKILAASPYNISGGQKRRVAIASVIAARPSYLVLDEPTAGLDGKASDELINTLRKFAEEGMGIIHITHDIELALALSAKILVLEEGRTLSWASPEETAALICEKEIKGLAMPEVLELAKRLKRAGKIDALAWSPEALADKLRNR
ncbi:MAG: ATP-binding cassette domain-containing protein [bacterium]|nr:ATP-binding cassette domain-containing protein [bacterium]